MVAGPSAPLPMRPKSKRPTFWGASTHDRVKAPQGEPWHPNYLDIHYNIVIWGKKRSLLYWGKKRSP